MTNNSLITAIVTPNALDAKVVVSLLGENGILSQSVTRCPTSLRVLHHRPDVALVDIGLPLMNGYEVARAIRKRIPAENLRLIALSGYGQRDDVARATQAGFDMHLLKPIDPDPLQRLLSQ